MSKFKLIILLVLYISPTLSIAQSIKNVRINEIQVYNVNGFRDEYGRTGSWIELFNKGYGKVDLAGCILKVRGQEYKIPKGDPATIVQKQGYIVFFASGTPNKGTFHTNLTLIDTDFIELYDTNGELIDCLNFNLADMIEDVSYGWFEDNDGKESLRLLPATTPGSTNNTEEKIPKAEIFKQADPAGIVLTITNIFIVTIALTLLFFIFKYMGRFHIKFALRRKEIMSMKHNRDNKFLRGNKKRMVTNDELAVIAIALYKYSKSLHDNEELTLTINKVSKAYSPWSSKIYGLRQMPHKK